MAVVAKGKQKRSQREEDRALEKTVKVPTRAAGGVTESRVRASEVRPVVAETLAQVYGEMWNAAHTHDHKGDVEVGINEEAYIITLTLFVGNEIDTPRRTIPMRETDISDQARYCKQHK